MNREKIRKLLANDINKYMCEEEFQKFLNDFCETTEGLYDMVNEGKGKGAYEDNKTMLLDAIKTSLYIGYLIRQMEEMDESKVR